MRREIKFRLLHESPGDPKKWIYGWPNVDGSSFDDVRNAFKNEMTYNNTCREIVRRYTDMRIEDLRKIFLLYDKNRKLKERIDMLEKGLAESQCCGLLTRYREEFKGFENPVNDIQTCMVPKREGVNVLDKKKDTFIMK